MTNAFKDWAGRGFGPALLPIIPPNAALTAQTQVKPHYRGKTPGLRGRSGQWYGYGGWHGVDATPADHAAWAEMGAGVGLQCGRYVAVDIDVLDAGASALLDELAIAMLGAAPLRVGRAPKRVRLYAAAAGVKVTKRRIAFRLPGMEADAKPYAVEILGEGQQFVVDGVHPDTGQPYAWPEGRPVAFELVPITAEMLNAYEAGVVEAIASLGGEVTARGTGGEGDRDDLDQDRLRAPSPAILAEAMGALPNTGDRDDWIRVGHAIKAAGGTLDQWAEWSERWGPEDPDDLAKRWGGFRPPFAAGWPQIERAARAAGWMGGVVHEFASAGLDLAAITKEAEASAAAKAAADEAEAPRTVQDAMFARYVWVEAVERIGDTEDKSLLTRVQFNARLAEIGPPHDSRRCAWAQFLEAKHGVTRARRVAGVTYRPGGDAVVEEAGKGSCFNTWRPSSVVPRLGAMDSDVAPWLDLVRRVVPDAHERGVMLDWLSFLVQCPGSKPAFVLVLGGHEGIGKDSILAPVVRALGQHNVQNVTMATVMGPQTHWVANCQLVIITEMHSFARREVMERLKPIGAAPPDMLEVNRKFIPQYDVPNIVAGCYFTNHPDALALSDSDRRHFVVWSPHENPEAMEAGRKQAFEAWFRRVYYPWLDAGGAEAVAGWLRTRDLAAFKGLARAPMTDGKAMMRREGRSEAVASVEDALEAMGLPDLVNPEDLAARVNAGTGRGAKPVTGHAVGRALRAMGARQVSGAAVAVPPTALVSGARRVRIWALRDADGYAAMRDVVLARKFAEMWSATKQDIDGFFAGQVSPLHTSDSHMTPKSGEG